MKIISVDFQKDFSSEEGQCYCPRPCVGFIKKTLIPFVESRGTKIAEIVSDYRLPRPGVNFAACIPGEEGYESEIPMSVKLADVWVKCMNSPVWIRKNGGEPGKRPGTPYPSPKKFSRWLENTVGPPDPGNEIILIGLTLDCCVLCTAQELSFRGYNVRFLVEAVDPYSGDAQEKQYILKTPLANWGQPIKWKQLHKSEDY
ncbi:hypothetical protein ACFL35_18510 [Candidatus Riflebacteria bacterium]